MRKPLIQPSKKAVLGAKISKLTAALDTSQAKINSSGITQDQKVIPQLDEVDASQNFKRRLLKIRFP